VELPTVVKTGLLLGAGFSKDFGLPLVPEVTKTFKEISKKYWSLDNAARIRADRWADEIAQEVRTVLERDEMHFEAILGYFQVQQIRAHTDRRAGQVYASLYSRFAEIVSEIIYDEPIARLRSFRAVSKEYLPGLRLLVEQNRPLLVFSLNYDLVVECLAADLGVTVESGLPDKGSLVRRHSDGRETGRLPIEAITGDRLEKAGLIFPTANPVFSSGEQEAIYLINSRRLGYIYHP
jgi:hypothetical protein